MRRTDVWTPVQAGAWLIVLVVLVWPLSSVVVSSLTVDGHASLANFTRILVERRFLQAIGNTVVVGVGGMCGAVLLGVTLAYVLTRYAIRGRRLIEILALMAMLSPPFIGAYAWIMLFGASGAVRQGLMTIGLTIPPIYGMAGVILVFSLKFFPNVFLITSGAFAAVSRSLEEAAEGLGMSPFGRFMTVTLPLTLPAIAASGLLAFVLSIADFGTPQIIGRNVQVLATQAFALYSADLGSDQGLASAISLVLVVMSVAFLLVQRRLMLRAVDHGSGLKKVQRLRARGWRSAMLHALAYGIVSIGMVPAVVVAISSFRQTKGPVFQPGFGLQSYRSVVERAPEAVLNTLTFSGLAVLGIVVVGTVLGYVITRRPSPATAVLDGLLTVPYVVPGVVVGIAYTAAFNAPPIVLTGTGSIIVLSIFVRCLPYTVGAVGTALSQVSSNLEDAAVSLGVPPGRAFLKVTAPADPARHRRRRHDEPRDGDE